MRFETVDDGRPTVWGMAFSGFLLKAVYEARAIGPLPTETAGGDTAGRFV